MSNPTPQAPREEIIWQGSPSWKGMLSWYFKWLAAAVFVTACFGLAARAGAVSTVTAVAVGILSLTLVFVWGYVLIKTCNYRITTRRVECTSGIIRRITESAPIARIDNVTVEINLWERAMKIGRIDFDTAGEQGNLGRRYGHSNGLYLYWRGVPYPRRVAALVEEVQAEHQSLWSDARPTGGAPPPVFAAAVSEAA